MDKKEAKREEDILSAFDNLKMLRSGHFTARCPCARHRDDGKNTLSISITPKKAIKLHCVDGCRVEQICEAAGLDPKILKAPPDDDRKEDWEYDILNKAGTPPKILSEEERLQEEAHYKEAIQTAADDVKEYEYKDTEGNYLYTAKVSAAGDREYYHKRYGKVVDGLGKLKPTLFELPRLLRSIMMGETIYLVEDEKDAQKLIDEGLSATTMGGFAYWDKEYAKCFAGAVVVVVENNNEVSKQNAKNIMRDIKNYAWESLEMCPSLEETHAVSSFFEAGSNKAVLENFVKHQPKEHPIYVTVDYFTGAPAGVNNGLLASTITTLHEILLKAGDLSTGKSDIYIYKDGVYKVISTTSLEAMANRYVYPSFRGSSLASNVSKMIAMNARDVDFSEFNSDESIINFQNGLYNIRSHKLFSHTPKVLSTVQLTCDYDLEAEKPERFLQFIDTVCTDDDGVVDVELRMMLQEVFGFAISQIYGYRLKTAVMLYSPRGNTGKSVILNVIGALLGDVNICSISIQDLSGTWATGYAYGKRAILVGDQQVGDVENSSVFKSITGGDRVEAQKKYKDVFFYRFLGFMLMAANKLPVFEDDKGDHMTERLTIIPCTNVIPASRRDASLTDKLCEEKEGIVQWALEGLDRLIKNGLKFSKSKVSEKVKHEYKMRSDTLFAFVTTCYDRTGDNKDYVRKTTFEQKYEEFCSKEGFHAVNKRIIPDRMASIGITMKKLDGYDVYRGIKVKDFAGDKEQDDMF